VGGEVLDFPEPDVGFRFAAGGDVGSLRPVDLEPRRAPSRCNVRGSVSRPKGKASCASVTTLTLIASRPACAYDDACHRPFLGGADLAGQATGACACASAVEKERNKRCYSAANSGIHLPLLSCSQARASAALTRSGASRHLAQRTPVRVEERVGDRRGITRMLGSPAPVVQPPGD